MPPTDRLLAPIMEIDAGPSMNTIRIQLSEWK